MKIDTKWWSVIAVIIISLLVILIINGNSEVKKIEGCKTQRIRPFSQQFFSWGGIVELNKSGKYQPSCL